ncbi:MAG: DUF7226 domain-containing protein [Candidatus Binataceae bacterium]
MKVPSVDIPQADTLDLIVEILATAWKGGNQRASLVAAELGIVPRQVTYYRQAARILGLANLKDGVLTLTAAGEELMSATGVAERHALLRGAVLKTPLIESLLRDRRAEELSTHGVEQYIRRKTSLSGATIPRRAHTLLSWLRHISSYDPFDPTSLAAEAAKAAPEEYAEYRSREEGQQHRTLKETVAANPGKYLGEGLKLIQVEFPFPTNDRADILFVDKNDRYFVVEIEVDVGPRDLPGLLQAVKYKHMLAVIHGVPPQAVRSALVARKIDPAIKDRATDRDIICIEVRGVI